MSKNTPWNGKYAAVNCFGFGGANVHVLIKCPESRIQPVNPERVLSPTRKKKDDTNSQNAIVGENELF